MVTSPKTMALTVIVTLVALMYLVFMFVSGGVGDGGVGVFAYGSGDVEESRMADESHRRSWCCQQHHASPCL